jgi:hypothetical protein
MNMAHLAFRLTAVTLVAVLAFGLATPARAEALEPLTLVALASLAVVGVIIVVYLVVANMAGSRRSEHAGARHVVCVESDSDARTCWTLPEAAAPSLTSDLLQS